MADNDLNQAVVKSPDDIILTINRTAAHYLLETSKWGTFLSIMGFILCVLMVLLGLFAGTIMSSMTQGQMSNMPRGFGFLMGFIYAIMGLLYFFPSWYLLKYSQKLKSALSSKDSSELVIAFENQKSVYKFWGIFSIVMISTYAIMLMFVFVFSALK